MPNAASGLLTEAGVGPGDRLCCALSGGVDSVVLLQMLHELRPAFGFDLCAAHVHHHLSPRADAWAAFCTACCARLEIPCSVLHVDVPANDPEGLEAAARRARHAALDAVACDWLVFGHHQDDQAETLLFRLMRGTGLRGAGAMAPLERPAAVRRGRLRPLLGLRRAEIEAWARDRGLAWVDDDSNADCRFRRNALRHGVMPPIERIFPAAVPALARAAEHFREASALLDQLAALDEAACGGAMLERTALLALDDARVANLLRWQARCLGAPAPTRARLGEALRQLREAGAVRPLHLALGPLACCAYRGQVWLEEAAPERPLPTLWRREDELPWGAGSVLFRPASGAGLDRARLDGARELRLLPRWPGLRLRQDARRPSRSFKNLCQEAGIPAWMRERLPVLVADGEVAWVGGIGTAAAFACAPGAEGVEPVWRAARAR